ncbi:MAG: RluA family pseudouridine synthase [Gammaproteobacteria bacterium]|nr:RluA family pseudouridine synthase [Gammaproteobacteria bacterium]MXY57081.1 RluA family pseudouridine synthase [Gammaproteobacteria bacterium]MYF27571.1 RluA family pseudouridine synthase [Gammaproteobacteria bacterium]MYK46128.1 RluA family pseudouridine synthase [Gammaproteobacteria bacterium]
MAAEVNIVAVDAEHGQRLDNFLIARMKGLPRSRIYRMVRRGEVRVNGARCRPGYRVQQGDRVRIPPFRGEPPSGSGDPDAGGFAETLRNATVYEDDDLLVIDKPSGVAVHGGSGISLGVIEVLRRNDPSVPFALVHRLDRDTSGCLAVAKNRRALLALHAQLRKGAVAKRYDLVVDGHWPTHLGVVHKPLARYALANGERRVRVQDDGHPSTTAFRVVDRLADATWLAAFPRTGRTHQIRVHAAASGHPILGDAKYARHGVEAHARLFLHASELTFLLRDRRVKVNAPVPAEFDRLRARRRLNPRAVRVD